VAFCCALLLLRQTECGPVACWLGHTFWTKWRKMLNLGDWLLTPEDSTLTLKEWMSTL